MPDLPSWDLATRLLVAALCGGLIGLDREAKSRPAGLRTMILVALGAALFALLGDGLAPKDQAAHAESVSRVLQGLVGGIGFLGAATVFRNRTGAQGVTTAATVWVVAAIGASCGLAEYAPALVTTAVTAFTLVVIKQVERVLPGGTGDTGPGSESQETASKGDEEGDSK
jgi:putative Mg2+ transporter-C (MgtC) family protein